MAFQQPVQAARPPIPVGPAPPRTINKEIPVGPGPNTIASWQSQGISSNLRGGQLGQGATRGQGGPFGWGRGWQRGRGFARGRGRRGRGGLRGGMRGGMGFQGQGQGQNQNQNQIQGLGQGQGQQGQGRLQQTNMRGRGMRGRGRGMRGGRGRGAGFVTFGGAVFSRNYIPVQLERQQVVEQTILHHVEPNYKPLYEAMDAALKTWKCASCGLVNQLYYLKCTGCSTFLPTALRVGMLINICKTYLQGWDQYNNNQFNLSTLFASNVNRLYLVTLNPDGPFVPNSQLREKLKHCVIRIFKPDHLIEYKRKQMDECYKLFSEANLGPKILARFEIGQIEEHIDGKKIYHQKQFKDEVMETICEKIATIHKMKPDENIYNKEKDTFGNKFKAKCEEMKKYINMNKDQLLLEGFEFTGKDLKTIGEILTLFPNGVDNIIEQYEWIESEMKQLLNDAWWDKDNNMVFSHNDLYQGNIMEIYTKAEVQEQMKNLSGDQLDQYISENYGGDLKIIDYDTCCYNYRYYDISNWLIELCIEYFRIIQYPFVIIDWNMYPDHEFRAKFVKKYLTLISNKSDNDIKDEDVELFLHLIDLYGLLSDLYQGVSTFVYGIQSEHRGHAVVRGGKRRYDEPEQIRMDYFEYAVNRLKNYWFSKDQITNDHESDRIDPNLGYNLGPNASLNQNPWYLGYGPILQNLGQDNNFNLQNNGDSMDMMNNDEEEDQNIEKDIDDYDNYHDDDENENENEDEEHYHEVDDINEEQSLLDQVISQPKAQPQPQSQSQLSSQTNLNNNSQTSSILPIPSSQQLSNAPAPAPASSSLSSSSNIKNENNKNIKQEEQESQKQESSSSNIGTNLLSSIKSGLDSLANSLQSQSRPEKNDEEKKSEKME